MIWSYFVVFAIISVLLWAVGAWASWRNRRSLAFITTGLGLCVFFSYILIMWITLERPPLRTMGETRLWYSFFLPLAGMIVYSRWQYKWILSFSTLLATVFVCVNLFKPEIHSKTLMPALQSPWFAPHVIVYMMAYASWERSGQRKHGVITGHGTQRKHGQLSLGSLISFMFITASIVLIICAQPSSSSL